MASAAAPIEYHETRVYSLLELVLRERALRLTVVVAGVASALSIALALFHLYVAVFGTPETRPT